MWLLVHQDVYTTWSTVVRSVSETFLFDVRRAETSSQKHRIDYRVFGGRQVEVEWLQEHCGWGHCHRDNNLKQLYYTNILDLE